MIACSFGLQASQRPELFEKLLLVFSSFVSRESHFYGFLYLDLRMTCITSWIRLSPVCSLPLQR